jgi:hypothetical protein
MNATETTTRTWKSLGTMAALDGHPAECGSSRIYYRCNETGELCYRKAGWRNLIFCDHGPGIGIEAAACGNWHATGAIYPDSEF